jgi:hypothetical protein
MSQWSYPASGGGRDLRLDFLRGLCLAKMVFNHLWATPLHGAQYWIGYVTAAEGFFFISGTVAGIVYGRRREELGAAATRRALLRRAGDLYLANLALVLVFLALEAAGHLPVRQFAYWDKEPFWPWVFSFDQAYTLHVLPRYVAFLAATPLALWCLRTRRTPWLLAGSAALWLGSLAAGGLRLPWLESEGFAGFPLLAWQLLFFSGLALGYHRRRAAGLWRRVATPPVGWALAAGCVAFALHARPDALGWTPLPAALAATLFARDDLGPGRLVNLTLVFALAFMVTDRLWGPLERWAGPFLLPLGQRALAVFLLHIPVVWLAVVPHRLSLAVGLAFDAGVLTLLWLAARRPRLLAFVPN